jgi:hypothetical protein
MLDRGKFILTLKAALLLGESISGSFGLEVGHEAVIQIINLFRRELHKNEGKKVTWMTDEAAAHASKLNLLGVAGIDIALIYALGGLDIVMNLYDAMTSTGKGGPIAHTIMTYNNREELRAWCINATPDALGPMLMTLSTEATSFEITSETGASEQSFSYTANQAQVLQQKAIDTIINWITQNANKNSTLSFAQQQFQNACMCMDKLGVAPTKLGAAYCQNRYTLDQFMSDAALALSDNAGINARSRYKTNASLLGKQIDGYCSNDYGANSYFPTTTVKYTGPEITQ